MSDFSIIWITNSSHMSCDIELWWIMGKPKILRWKSTLWLDKIDLLISIGSYRLTCWYQPVWLDDLTCLAIICKKENTKGEAG